MTDDLVKQALAELGDVVRCHCDEAFRDRGLQDPECNCDSMDAVRVVIARVEWLEREKREAALDALAAMGQAQEAYEAQLKAEAKLAEVERERDEWKSRHFKMRDDRDKAKIAARNYSEFNHEWRKRADAAEAKLAKAVVALRGASSFLWHMTNAIDDEDYKGPHDGFNVPLVCHVQPYHDLHVEQLKTQAENVNAVLAEIEGGKKDE